MLFEAQTQPTVFLWLTLGGLFCGFLLSFETLFQKNTKKMRFFQVFFDLFATFFSFFIWFLLNLKFNYGQIRFFSILTFLCAFIIGLCLSKKIIAKTLMKCYNKINEKRKNRKKTNQRI